MGSLVNRSWLAAAPRLLGPATIALVAYVPLVLTAPGVVVADTKSYLTIDPARLLSRAWSMWDPSLGAGTVTHQNIGYLWPMGPWYWTLERLGLPDWLAQRLWLGTIIALAGYGTVWLLRTLGWRGPEVWGAGLLFALSPYVLTVAARISVLLLPFAALPWLIAITHRALRERGWRWPATFALVVATCGSVNLTALVLAGVGPALYLGWSVGVGAVRLRVAGGAVTRAALLAVPTSLWWLAGLWVQGGWGLDVLRYTETAEVVARTSSAHEVLRQLGYWFFYGGDKLGPWIEPSEQYTQRLVVIALSFALPVAALAGAALARFRHRSFFVLLLVAGTTLAVGAHRWDDPTLAASGFKALLRSERGLAMRSLPRAVPLVALASAVLLAAGAVAVIRRLAEERPRRRVAAAVVLGALAVANLPALWLRQTVPANLRRDEEIPSWWVELGEHLDATDDGTRVLEVPGADFASYRWGNTIDPVLPGLMDRPDLYRELIPYGTAPSADLLIALDHRLQERLLDPDALAPVARFLGVGALAVRNDLQYERYKAPRPEDLWALVTSAPGLGEPVGFGPSVRNEPVPEATLFDGLFLQLPPQDPPPAVAAVPVLGTEPLVRARPDLDRVVLAGDGEGVVDAAGAGLLDGTELLLYAADLVDPSRFEAAVADGAHLVVTDSNRRRGRRWTTVRHNTGHTTEAGEEPLVEDLSVNDLPMFPGAGDDSRTVAEHRGGVHARATSFGNPITFTAEERAANAVDGDPATAWRSAAFADPRGERLELRYDEPQTAAEVVLLQPQTGEINRSITSVRLRFDGGAPLDFALGPASEVGPGQRLEFDARTFDELSIEILADSVGPRPRYNGLTSVGFAEVQVGPEPLALDEVIRLPVDLLGRLGDDSAAHPLDVVLTRQRSDPTDSTRADEEPAMARAVELPTGRTFELRGTARVSAHASDAVLDSLLGPGSPAVVAEALPRLDGARGARGAAAVDGDLATAWETDFGDQEGATLALRTAAPVTASVIELALRTDGSHSIPTRIGVAVDGVPVGTVDVPAPPVGRPEVDTLGATSRFELALPGGAPVTGSAWRFTVEAVDAARTLSWDSGQPVTMPVGVAELHPAGAVAPAVAADTPLDTGCRTDLLTAGGQAVPIRITGTVGAAAGGQELDVAGCAPIGASPGELLLRGAEGARTGIDLDQLVLHSAAEGGQPAVTGAVGGAEADGPHVELVATDHDEVRVAVRGARPGEPAWLSLGQSASDGWHLEVDGDDAGTPWVVDGYASGWRIDAPAASFTATFRFGPQRAVDAALRVSAVAAAACIAIALVGWRRGPRSGDAPAPEPTDPEAWSGSGIRSGGTPPATVEVVVAVVGVGAAAAVLAGPIVALVAAAATAVAARWRAARAVTALGAPAALAVAAAYVLVQQVRHRIAPGLEWPGEFERMHPVGWLAATLLLADLVVEHLWRRRSAEGAPQ